MPLILGANSVSGYTVKNSLRFNSGSSDDLSRTISVAGDRQKFTISTWVKRGSLTVRQQFIGAYTDANNYFYIEFSANDTMYIADSTSSALGFDLTTTQVFRDPSAWYHILLAVDTTQATNTNRLKLYVNGSQVTAITATYPVQNFSGSWNKGSGTQRIGYRTSGFYFSGYQSEVYHIDGQALTPSSFGETDTDTGIWKPKAYTGTYGTNGFYLKFANSASLGTDSSGNGNTFTVNNLTSIDQTTDTPTNNFATWNPLFFLGNQTLTEGNLRLATGTTGGSIGTIAVNTGKWYWETKLISSGTPDWRIAGLVNVTVTSLTSTGSVYYVLDGTKAVNNVFTAYGATLANNDIIGTAIDVDARSVTFYKNGVSQGAISLSSVYSVGDYITASGVVSGGSNTTVEINFGNPPYSANSYTDGAGYGNFSYAVPSGYYSLNTKNLANFG